MSGRGALQHGGTPEGRGAVPSRSSSRRPPLALYIGLLLALVAPQDAFGFLSGPPVASTEIARPGASQGPVVRIQVVGTRNAGITLLYVLTHVASPVPMDLGPGSALIFALPETIVHLHADSALHRSERVCDPGCVYVESAAFPISQANLRLLARAETAEIVLVGRKKAAVMRALPVHLANIRAFVTRYLDRPGPST